MRLVSLWAYYISHFHVVEIILKYIWAFVIIAAYSVFYNTPTQNVRNLNSEQTVVNNAIPSSSNLQSITSIHAT